MGGLGAGLVHLTLGVGAALAYSIKLKSTWLSWLPYRLAFGSLPGSVSLLRDPAAMPPLWIAAVGALLGFAAHLLNAMPDLTDDAANGVRSFPHRLHPYQLLRGQALSLVAATVVAVFGSRTPPTAGRWILLSAVLVLAVGAARATGRDRSTQRSTSQESTSSCC